MIPSPRNRTFKKVQNNFDSVPEEMNVNPTVGSFITCIYDSYWWVGLVDSVSKEHSDCEVNFLHPHGPRKMFQWPTRVDKCFVPHSNILCSISAPKMSSSTARFYTISDNDFEKTISTFERFHQD